MHSISYNVRPKNPFKKQQLILSRKRITSPAAGRIEILWKKYKEQLQSYPSKTFLPSKKT